MVNSPKNIKKEERFLKFLLLLVVGVCECMFRYERETETDRNERRYLSPRVPWCLSGDDRTVGDSFVASIPLLSFT